MTTVKHEGGRQNVMTGGRKRKGEKSATQGVQQRVTRRHKLLPGRVRRGGGRKEGWYIFVSQEEKKNIGG